MTDEQKCTLCSHRSYYLGCCLVKDCEYKPNWCAKTCIEELEQIKKEIDEVVEEEIKEYEIWALGLRYSKKIIDKHISKLKGE